MTIPPELRGPFFPRDPLQQGPPAMPAPSQSTAARVEQERGALQAALQDLARRTQRLAGS
jgi:hypothetical protein